MYYHSIIILSLMVSPSIWGQDLNSLLKKVDELYQADTSQTTVEMEIKTPHWKRTLKMDIATKGLEKTFVTILSPKKDRGISTLKRNTEMWNFFPKINKIINL